MRFSEQQPLSDLKMGGQWLSVNILKTAITQGDGDFKGLDFNLKCIYMYSDVILGH